MGEVMEKVYFESFEVREDTILARDKVKAWGFLNTGNAPVSVGAYTIPQFADPQDVTRLQQNIIWFPVAENERDATVYRINFIGAGTRRLIVFVKVFA